MTSSRVARTLLAQDKRDCKRNARAGKESPCHQTPQNWVRYRCTTLLSCIFGCRATWHGGEWRAESSMWCQGKGHALPRWRSCWHLSHGCWRPCVRHRTGEGEAITKEPPATSWVGRDVTNYRRHHAAF